MKASTKSNLGLDTLGDVSLLCNLCEEYLDSPKLLQCKHSFCRSCLQQFCLTDATDVGFPCPTCKTQVKVKDPNQPITEWVDTIPTDHDLNKRLEKIRLLENEKKKEKCVFCLSKWKAIVATKYCKACQEYFCTECGNQHWLLRRSKDHRVWLIEDLITLKTDALLRSDLDLVFNANVQNKRAKNARTRRNSIKLVDGAKGQVTGASFLPNGSVALADKGNETIKLFDNHFRFVTAFRTNCHEILAFNDYFIAVTCPLENCLKILSIYEKEIEQDESFELGAACYGLCYTDEENDTDNFAVAVATRPVQIILFSGLSRSGKIEVEQGQKTLLVPEYITFSKTKQLFILSDRIHQCLKCVTKMGKVVWERRIEEACGVAIFHDNILLARSDRQTVDLIKLSGQILKSVVSREEGLLRVNTLCSDHWHLSTNTARVLVADNTDLIRIFVVEDPLLDEDIRSYINKSTPRRGSSTVDSDKPDDKNTGICSII